MKRIDIQWNTEKVCVTGKDMEISGVITVWEGENTSNMQPTHSFRVVKSKYFTGLFRTGNNSLPELTDVEDDILRTMISSFYLGFTKDGYCSHWLERT
jgi:hypothetical protein